MIMETNGKVQYTLKRRKGQKRVYLRIQSDGSLVVTAGESVSQACIDALVLEKWPWYLKTAGTKTVEHDYRDGDSFHLLGKPLVLEVVVGAERNVCMAKEGRLVLMLRGKVSDEVSKLFKQRLIKEEYSRHLKAFLENRIPFWADRMNIRPVPCFRLNNAVRQWASCSAKRELSFSVKSASLAPELLDYLIVHELSHIRHMNHGPQFKALVESILPDWKNRKARLSKEYFDSFI